ncbi:hypothetical protein KKG22_00865 [Patescibacteria group bacterium]|nr:hypothetical protein [Patescibacteria group bacterium]MBU1721986.1 hypothetical protein [Patescibacteria group bacterium]MBU1901265.1 hypothetical protein [Patescibacteria group bacterium]
MPLILSIIFIITAILFVVYGIYATKSGAPFWPTGRKKVKQMIQLAELTKDDVVMDLGSGDGRIVRAAAPYVTRAIGIEINPVLHYWALFLRLCSPYKKQMIFEQTNLWKTDLSEIDVLFLFFMPDKMEKLHQKIKKEMKPGSRIVSNIFQFPGWSIVKKHDMIYVYQLS